MLCRSQARQNRIKMQSKALAHRDRETLPAQHMLIEARAAQNALYTAFLHRPKTSHSSCCCPLRRQRRPPGSNSIHARPAANHPSRHRNREAASSPYTADMSLCPRLCAVRI
jgi:hypothetical protein